MRSLVPELRPVGAKGWTLHYRDSEGRLERPFLSVWLEPGPDGERWEVGLPGEIGKYTGETRLILLDYVFRRFGGTLLHQGAQLEGVA